MSPRHLHAGHKWPAVCLLLTTGQGLNIRLPHCLAIGTVTVSFCIVIYMVSPALWLVVTLLTSFAFVTGSTAAANLKLVVFVISLWPSAISRFIRGFSISWPSLVGWVAFFKPSSQTSTSVGAAALFLARELREFITIAMISFRQVNDSEVEFLKFLLPTNQLPNRVRCLLEVHQREVISSDGELVPQEILFEQVHEIDNGQEFLSGHKVVSFCSGICTTGISYYFLFATLNFREHCPDGMVTHISVQDVKIQVGRLWQHGRRDYCRLKLMECLLTFRFLAGQSMERSNDLGEFLHLTSIVTVHSPMKDVRQLSVAGMGQVSTALIFWGSVEIQFSDTTCLKKLTLLCNSWHFDGFSNRSKMRHRRRKLSPWKTLQCRPSRPDRFLNWVLTWTCP